MYSWCERYDYSPSEMPESEFYFNILFLNVMSRHYNKKSLNTEKYEAWTNVGWFFSEDVKCLLR